MNKKVTLAADKFERFIFLLNYALEWYSYMASANKKYEDEQGFLSYNKLLTELSELISILVFRPRCEDLVVIDSILAHQLQIHYSYINYAFMAYVEDHGLSSDNIIENLVNSLYFTSEPIHPSAKVYRLIKREHQASSKTHSLSNDPQSQFEYFNELNDIFLELAKILYD